MSICPICKSSNYQTTIKNCHENIHHSNNFYNYKYCLDCLVISQDPLPENEILTKHYKYIESLKMKQLNSKRGLDIFLKIKDSYKKRNLKNVIRNILKFGENDYNFFNLLNHGKILDLGSGTGLFSIAAKQQGFNVISLEQSEASFQISKKIGTNVILSDLNSKLAMDFASKVDNITLNHVFEHLLNPLEFLKNLRKNIKQNTKVVIVVPNSSSIWRYIFREKWYGWDPPLHLHLYNQKSLRIIMNKAGYKIEYLSCLNRIDALSIALKTIGFKLNSLKFLFRIISFALAPYLKKFNIAPEIICVVSKV